MMAKGKRWLGLAIISAVLLIPLLVFSQQTQNQFTIARLKYGGGGDWYWGPSALPNLLTYIRQNVGLLTAADEARISISDDNFFSHPFLYMTGHGNVRFTDEETRRLRTFLTRGGVVAGQ